MDRALLVIGLTAALAVVLLVVVPSRARLFVRQYKPVWTVWIFAFGAVGVLTSIMAWQSPELSGYLDPYRWFALGVVAVLGIVRGLSEVV